MKFQPGSGGRVAPNAHFDKLSAGLEGRIETTTFKKYFSFLKLIGRDAARSTNGLLLRQTVKWLDQKREVFLHINNQLSPGKLSDETLIARVARSDRTALETLYDRYAPMIMGISLSITGNRAVAEEVLQETFWQVWQGAASYQVRGGSFTSWLFRLTRELAMDAHHWKLNNK